MDTRLPPRPAPCRRLGRNFACSYDCHGSADKSVAGMPFEPKETPRMGLIGAGDAAADAARMARRREPPVTAVCDPVKAAAAKAAAAVEQRGQNAPAIYDKGETDTKTWSSATTSISCTSRRRGLARPPLSPRWSR